MAKRPSHAKIGRLVLDVLKPHDPSLPEFATRLKSLEGVKGVTVTLIEIDRETDTLKVTIEGELDYAKIRSAIEEWGGVIHSVDEVSIGSLLTEAQSGRRTKTCEEVLTK